MFQRKTNKDFAGTSLVKNRRKACSGLNKRFLYLFYCFPLKTNTIKMLFFKTFYFFPEMKSHCLKQSNKSPKTRLLSKKDFVKLFFKFFYFFILADSIYLLCQWAVELHTRHIRTQSSKFFGSLRQSADQRPDVSVICGGGRTEQDLILEVAARIRWKQGWFTNYILKRFHLHQINFLNTLLLGDVIWWYSEPRDFVCR